MLRKADDACSQMRSSCSFGDPSLASSGNKFRGTLVERRPLVRRGCRPWGPSGVRRSRGCVPLRIRGSRGAGSCRRTESTAPSAAVSWVHRRHRPRLWCRPGLRVAWGVEGEDVGEGSGGRVACGERISQVPLLAQCGDERRVAVLLVEHLAFGDPRRHDDGRDSVAGPVEREAELAGRGRRIRTRHRRRRDVVIGAARLVPADEQRRVPDVGARRATASPDRRCRSVRGTLRRRGSTTAGRCRATPRRDPRPDRRRGGSRCGRSAMHGSMNEKSGRSPFAASASNCENGTKCVAN